MTEDLATGDHLQVLWDQEARCYLLRYLSGPKRARMLDLFGVDTLPLPWTAEAPSVDVLTDGHRRNPNATVEEGKP